jgi:hypothetical protein
MIRNGMVSNNIYQMECLNSLPIKYVSKQTKLHAVRVVVAYVRVS